MIETNYPLKVVCPHCHAAIGAKCTEPFFSIGSSTRFVNWFHFSRIERAQAAGYAEPITDNYGADGTGGW